MSIVEKNIDYVIGGFHLYNHNSNTSEAPERIKQIGKQLKETGAKYYTCHCTGDKPYEYLKEVMKDRIEYLSTGSVIKI
jgi:7,8-dihydropterin-6-yl-methyl-4-(beta-D-ribofuranosyl)aminobenzene 5'-phosphate synthase